MEEKLREILERWRELSESMADPRLIADQVHYRELAKQHSDLTPLAEKIQELLKTRKALREAKEMQNTEKDPEMLALLQEEIAELTPKVEPLEEEVRYMLLPRDPNDDKDVIVEIRAGAGGQEASLFAGQLFRLYSHYVEKQKWKLEPLSSSPSDLGGFKEVIFEVRGKGAYSKLKFESGVHRVQRVPVTESGGRIHTSTATVAVLPQAEDVELKIEASDVRFDIFRSSGPGGQSVNTTDSAVRVTHLPTGLVVSCQDEKSQLQNREKAMRILRARLYEQMLEQQQSEIASARRSQVGTGDRSERIRTYNFPQGRLTDHRIGLTVYNLDAVMEGEIENITDALAAADRAEKLKVTG